MNQCALACDSVFRLATSYLVPQLLYHNLHLLQTIPGGKNIELSGYLCYNKFRRRAACSTQGPCATGHREPCQDREVAALSGPYCVPQTSLCVLLTTRRYIIIITEAFHPVKYIQGWTAVFCCSKRIYGTQKCVCG